EGCRERKSRYEPLGKAPGRRSAILARARRARRFPIRGLSGRAMTGARTRGILLILLPMLSVMIFVPMLLGLYWPAAGGLDVTGHQLGRDFINTWAGPQFAFSGQVPLLFDFPGYRDAISALFGAPLMPHAWSYPLFCLLLFWPIAQLPYFAALAVWTFGL